MRTALHIAVSMLLWGVFFYYWWIVTRAAVGRGAMLAIQVLSVLILAGAAATVWWIAHNRRLGRRNRRRTAPPAPPESLANDTLGRPIDAPALADLRRAALIEIAVVDGRKVYTPLPRGAAPAQE